jgi:transcriptional regulator NrdR family protein
MCCEKCGAKTRVTNSRTANADSTHRGALFEHAQKLVGWYTQDWVVRQRSCPTCGDAPITVEILSADFTAMLTRAGCQK